MLKIKVFKAFAALVLSFGLLSGVVGYRMIRSRVMREVQTRVENDLASAWHAWHAELRKIETVLRLTTDRRLTAEVYQEREWDDGVRAHLDLTRTTFGLDFLTFVSAEGTVVLRTTSAGGVGDLLLPNPALMRALRGELVTGTMLLRKEDLKRESEELADRALLALAATPHARATVRKEESRGMVMFCAAPVWLAGRIAGVVYGGALVNRNNGLIDRIKEAVYKDETYNGTPVGTATVFLGDTRVATTVRLPSGNRAIGTRVSREVADRVLDNALSWTDRAFVVTDWYLTAYDPIRDIEGRVIGMLYVGILERRFEGLGRDTLEWYVGLSCFALVAALVLAFLVAGRVVRPIHELANAADALRRGVSPEPLPVGTACSETQGLTRAFNHMADALREREARLKQANVSLEALNHSYMEMLGFVSHELKSPMAIMVNYAHLLNSNLIGQLNPKQQKAVNAIDRSVQLLMEMARHYLDLSRIENGELVPERVRVAVLDEIVAPLLEAFDAEIQQEGLTVRNSIGPEVVVHADSGMTREVFENLLSNALKYGRTNGELRIGCTVGGDQVEFAVRNQGEGIPAEKLPALFHKFSRLGGDRAADRRRGTGLGLFITKHIVEAHGGGIEAESIPGEWTEFRFSLPRFHAEQKAQSAPEVKGGTP